jgi:superfamily II DNA or RNA helicase
LAHTHHLLEQAFNVFNSDVLAQVSEKRKSLDSRVVSGTPGYWPAHSIKTSDDIVLATLQTITNAHLKDLKSVIEFLDAAGEKLFVVFDEAHHSPAPSYRRLLQQLQERGARVLGLTATPTYTDETKKGWLKKLFPQGILFQTRPAELFAQGILSHPNLLREHTSFAPTFDEREYQKWMGAAGDLPEDIVDQLAHSAERNRYIAHQYTENKETYGKTIIFTDRWYQCDAIVEMLKVRGVKAGAVYSYHGGSPSSAEERLRFDREENDKTLDSFRKGKLEVLVNVKMLTEGTDIPDAQTVFLTRQTTSQILLTQMVGRALRGPKFGGTKEAYIVSFIDDWQQAIRWAEWDPLREEGQADATRITVSRMPIELISIELVRRLARQMDGTVASSDPFLSQMPIGWYRATYDACSKDGDEIELRDELILVFDNERAGFESLIGELLKISSKVFESETITLSEQQPKITKWREHYFAGATRSVTDIDLEVFRLARHIGQGRGTPTFFPFSAREDHDLDRIAQDFVKRDLGPTSIKANLEKEFVRKDRFWRTMFPRFELMHVAYDACQRNITSGSDVITDPVSEALEPPITDVVDDEVAEQVKRRDGHCLACGVTHHLEVDHIVPRMQGGPGTIDNLQALCLTCNRKKSSRTINFANNISIIQSPISTLEGFATPPSASAADPDAWARYLRQELNFTYKCAAVIDVAIAKKGDGYYNWRVELVRGNMPKLFNTVIEQLVEKIQHARELGGKLPIRSLTIHSPGAESATWGNK